MKNKSARHKSNNTFKFLSFSERIANINVDIFHRVTHQNEEIELELHESIFFASLDKWEVLNLSECYGNFRKEINPHSIVTLAQVLFEQERIVNTLIKHLQLKNSLYLQPLLEHVLGACKDLGVDFYQYYCRFFSVFLELLNTKDVEVLEWTFHCLAYLFKVLWRPMIRNIEKVFLDLLPLLSDDKPVYINNFASESFAFVARKIKDRKSFLHIIIKCLKNHKKGIKGCGQLLFHTTNGINGLLHNYSEIFLPFLIDSLMDYEGESQIILFDILEEIFLNITSQIHTQKNEIFWKAIENSLDKFIAFYYENSDQQKSYKLTTLDMLLRLIGCSIEYKSGKFLSDPFIIIQRLVKILSFEEGDLYEIQLSAINISILLLNSCNIKLQQEHASSLTLKILSLTNKPSVLYFIDKANESSVFDTLILPTFLKICCNDICNTETYHVLTKLIMKKSKLSLDGINIEKWRKYPMRTSPQNNELQNYLNDMLIMPEVFDVLNRMESYICATICIPHIHGDKNNVNMVLHENIKKLCEGISLQISDDDIQKQKIVILINFTLQALIFQQEAHLILNYFDMLIDKLLPLCQNKRHLIPLRTVDLLFTCFRNNCSTISMENLEKVHKYLESNFNSAYSEIRLLTTHIYSVFETLFQETTSDPKEPFQVFTICYMIESISPQVDTYRDQLNLIENLSVDKPQSSLTKNTIFGQIPLRYLCGVLYLNFKLLWDPVIKGIATHANATNISMFWQVFGEELKVVSQNINTNSVNNESFWETEVDFLNEFVQEGNAIISKPDYVNYRLLLWKAMDFFASVAEAKNKDISALFLNFVQEEYTRDTSNSMDFCNIKQNVSKNDLDQSVLKYHPELDDDDVDIKNVENTTEVLNEEILHKDVAKIVQNKVGGKIVLKTLLQHLSLFSKVRNPLAMYRERELHSLYTELLSHRDHNVQKLALSCLLCYKSKHLATYADSLYKLIDPNSAKNELGAFRIDVDDGVIIKEHRATVVPIIIRLAFSKLTLKVREKGPNWRSLVIRFMGGCTSEEMLEFLRVTFRQYEKFLGDNVSNLEELTEVSNNINLTRFIHPKRLISTLNLIQIIFDSGGLLRDNILRYLLQILLVICSIVRGVYYQKHEVHSGYLLILRQLKNQCQKSIGHFFEHFYRFPFLRQELLSVYHFSIWPYIEKLPIEGVHSPTTLLHLLVQCWGANPRFFPLLNVLNINGKSVMPYIMDLLMNDKTNVSVVNAILDMVQRLLTLELDKVNADGDVLDLEETRNDPTLHSNSAALNYGSLILLPHAHQIMQKIQRKVMLSKSRTIGSRNLLILSRISELTSEEELRNELLEILIPICIRKCSLGNSNEEIIQQLLQTIYNLLLHVKIPSDHLRKLSPLFGVVALPTCRKIICEMLKKLLVPNMNQAECIDIAKLVLELNAYDAKWIDQPDFQRRLDGFKQMNRLIENCHIPADIGVLVIHNCYYLISIEKDLSLRDCATNCIKMITPKMLNTHPQDSKYIIDETLFSLIRASLKLKQDDVRVECIGILGYLARTCSKHHVVLTDLHILTNSEDPEVDFFENIVHLQIFRHGRALVTFCQILRRQTQLPCSRTLTQFILPLTTQYLCNERHASKNNIVDGAIDAVSVICRLLPWHQYEGLLKYYLAKLRHKIEYQKQLVRLIVAILDSFHFDLSKVQQIKEDTKDIAITIDATDKTEDCEQTDIVDDFDDVLEPSDLQEQFEEDSTEMVNVPSLAVDRITTLCKSSATRIIYTIKKILLPQLHRTLAELSSHEEAHKINRFKRNIERENDDLLRVPISLAVVKLLQKLPKQILDTNLPGVLMKLCSFLRSPLESVRRCTRETLQKIMIALGPQYLPTLLDSITPLLSKGFQSHVLVYTIHSVLSSLREHFKIGDIDFVLNAVNKMCMADLFGTLAEEKDVGKIGSKTSEAKSTKSFDTLQMLAQYLTESQLINMIVPLKNVLFRTHSYKIIMKVQRALRNVSQGLIANTFITNESLLFFSYGVSSDSIPQLQTQCNSNKSQSEEARNQTSRHPDSCLIIPKAPERHSSIFKTSKVTTDMNNYILIEFGLNVCLLLLKRYKLREEQRKDALDIENIRRYLDPFVVVFEKCLTSNHVKLCTITMQCLNWIIKYDLPSMKDKLIDFLKAIFSILHKYAAAGLSKGDNFDLVVATFKTVSTFLRHSSTTSSSIKIIPVTNDQLALLLMYVEQDLHSSDRQATAFHLLRAILAKRPSPPPIHLHDVILKIAELSIRSEVTHVRCQARACVHQYMIEFPIGKKKLDSMIGWYVNQLKYDLEPGRLMVIETLDGLIYAFPQPLLMKYSGTLLMTLGARLINDDSPDCRKNIAMAITTMFKKLPKENINDLFAIIVLWFNDDKIPTRQLAAQLICLLINVEKDSFEHRLPTLVPIIRAQFYTEMLNVNSPGRLVRIQPRPIASCSSDDDNAQTRIRDHYIFQLLKMLQKVAAYCPKFLQNVELIDSISTQIQDLMRHDHDWVRLGAAQFLGYVLATIDVQKLVNILQNKLDIDENGGYLYSNPKEQIKSLTLDLCAQLQPGNIRSELAEQIIKNLVFLAQVVQHIDIKKESIKQEDKRFTLTHKDNQDNSDSDNGNEDEVNVNITKTQINLMFLTKRMRKVINSEIVETPTKTTLRTEVFKWIGAICKTLHISNIRLVLHHLLAPLIRELNTSTISETEQKDSQKDLRQLANDVAKLIKNRVGIELYTETVAAVQRTLMQRRAERKRGRTQLALIDPEAFAKKKIRRHEKKRVAKKRKLATMKGETKPKKRRYIHFDDNSDVM